MLPSNGQMELLSRFVYLQQINQLEIQHVHNMQLKLPKMQQFLVLMVAIGLLMELLLALTQFVNLVEQLLLLLFLVTK
jgi:hypothetical protein